MQKLQLYLVHCAPPSAPHAAPGEAFVSKEVDSPSNTDADSSSPHRKGLVFSAKTCHHNT